jgi:predicted HAD superfamily Cof-like phosphohydrolase
MSTIDQVRKLHEVFEAGDPTEPCLPGLNDAVKQKLLVANAFLRALSKEFLDMAGNSIVALRASVELEELGEVLEATAQGDLEKVLHEKADQRVVGDGTLLAYGLAPYFHEMFDRVMESQWSKLDADGKPVKVNGRFVKGPNYVKPVLTGILPEPRR